MLRDNSAAIQQQAASATIGLPQLQAAFANIYATMDSIDAFKLKALDTMAATITTLEGEVTKSREYLDRVSRHDQQLATGALDLDRGRYARHPALSRCVATYRPRHRHGLQGLDRPDHRPGAAGCSGAGHAGHPGRAHRGRHPGRPRPGADHDRRWRGAGGRRVPGRAVSTTVRDTMPRLRNLGLGSPEAYSVMATATDYLPRRSVATPGCPGGGPTPARSRTARPR